ncbi:MAG: hypothetical protein ACYSSP_08775 [Planctomycetota bacterium]|jgi:hypothetical protein
MYVQWLWGVEPPDPDFYNYDNVDLVEAWEMEEPAFFIDSWNTEIAFVDYWDEFEQTFWMGDETEWNVYATAPAESTFLNQYVQVVYSEPTDPVAGISLMFEGWDGYRTVTDGYLGGIEIGPELREFVAYEEEEISPGVFWTKWEYTFTIGEFNEQGGMDEWPTDVSVLLVATDEFGTSPEYLIHEMDYDCIGFDTDEPPSGCVAARGGVIGQVSEASPTGGGHGFWDHSDDANVVLSFRAPVEAECIAEPNFVGEDAVDPNNYLQGPFKYTVYWSTLEDAIWEGPDGPEPNLLQMTQLVSDFSPDECNDLMSFDPLVDANHAPGTTYAWIVDVCDMNVTDFRPGGDPCLYAGPLFEYTTWGLPDLITPAEAEESVDTGSIIFYFETDGYAKDVNIQLLYEGEETEQAWLTPEANSWDPEAALVLGGDYVWAVEECNIVDGEEVCVRSESTFSTTFCAGIDDFEDYTTLAGTGNQWKDFYDENTTTSDNAVINHLNSTNINDTSTNNDPQYLYPNDGDDQRSMQVLVDRNYIDTIASGEYDDFTWEEPTGFRRDLTRLGGKSVWAYYKPDVDNGPIPADDFNIFMGFTDANTPVASVDFDYPGDAEEPGWSVFFVSISEITDAGLDATDIEVMRLGATGTADTGCSDCQITVYFDYLRRCAAVCPYDYGWPDLVTGGFAPDYIPLDADIAGEERELIDVLDEDGEPVIDNRPDCFVGEPDMEMIAAAWLDEDYVVIPVDPGTDNLVTEYLFTGNLNDSSGNLNHGTAVNDVNTADNYLVLLNDACDLLPDYNGVIAAVNDPCMFGGLDNSYSIAFDVQLFDVTRTVFDEEEEEDVTTTELLDSIIVASARPWLPTNWAESSETGGGAAGYIYDPCAEDVNNDPNCYGVTNPDPNWCDTSLHTYGYSEAHSLSIYARTSDDDYVVDRFYISEATAGVPSTWDDPRDLSEWVSIVHTYDADANNTTIWANGLPDNPFNPASSDFSEYIANQEEGGAAADPNVPDADEDILTIGFSYNSVFPAEGGGNATLGNFNMDNFRVYDDVLTPAEIMYLTTGTTTPVPVEVDPKVNFSSVLWDSNDIINFFDQAEFAPDWELESLFE